MIDEREVERSAYLEDRQLLYLQCAMEEHCVSASAYALKADPGEKARCIRGRAISPLRGHPSRRTCETPRRQNSTHLH